jgi:putative flippase GtrA
MRYAIVGASTAVAYYLLSWMLAELLGARVIFASVFSYVMTHPLAFLAHSTYTYRQRPSWRGYLKYCLGSGVTLATTTLLGLLGTAFSWGITITSFLVIFASPVTQILSNELLTFRRKS